MKTNPNPEPLNPNLFQVSDEEAEEMLKTCALLLEGLLGEGSLFCLVAFGGGKMKYISNTDRGDTGEALGLLSEILTQEHSERN